MTLKHLSIEPNLFGFSRNLKSLGIFAELLALGLGTLSLVTLLSCGAAYLAQTSGVAPVDIDQPLLGPELMIDSAIILGCCAAVVAIAELLRRRRRGVR